jgi:dolichol-phosphate mannosyltransferase
MSIDSIISFSDLPLKLIAMFGIFIALIGFGLTFYLLITKLFFVKYQPGYTSTVSIITFIGGVQIMVIGLAALYIGRILKEVQNRPLYIIREKINFAADV